MGDEKGDEQQTPTQERRRNTKSGQFQTEFPDDDFLTTIENHPEGATTTEIAEAVGCDRRTAYVRLQELEAKELITSRKVGNTLLWMR